MDWTEALVAEGLTVDDRRGVAPAGYLRATRDLAAVDRAVLHQMACAGSWAAGSRMWAKVRAHVVIRLDGSVVACWDPAARLRYGSGAWNATALTIEHQGNFPGRYVDGEPRWWKPEVAGRDLPAPAQVAASLAVLRAALAYLPGLRYVAPHRLVERRKPACCGPDLWREVGGAAIRDLGLVLPDRAPDGAARPRPSSPSGLSSRRICARRAARQGLGGGGHSARKVRRGFARR